MVSGLGNHGEDGEISKLLIIIQFSVLARDKEMERFSELVIQKRSLAAAV